MANWSADVAHSNVKFSVSHMVIAEAEGNFRVFDGTIVTTGDDFEGAAVNFTVDVASINTDNEGRDGHLKSDDFFNAEAYPKMTFASTSFTKKSDSKYILAGDLTIRDITQSVSFDVRYNGTVKDPWGNTKAGFKATTEINRLDYNLKWNALTEIGSMVVGKEVTIIVNLEVALQA